MKPSLTSLKGLTPPGVEEGPNRAELFSSLVVMVSLAVVVVILILTGWLSFFE